MLSDRLLELGGLTQLQRLAADKSPWAVLATLVLIASVGIIVDYARMLWLRSKMVSHDIPWSLPGPFTTDTALASGPLTPAYGGQHLPAA